MYCLIQVGTGLDQSVQLQHPQVVDHQTNQQQTSLSQIPSNPSSSHSTILEAQVLQTSENTTTTEVTAAEMNLMEQLAKTQGVSQTNHGDQVSTGESQVLHHINASELLGQAHGSNTTTVVIDSPMLVPSSQSQSGSTPVLDLSEHYQLQEQPVIQQEQQRIQQQLESMAQQVLVQPTNNIASFTSPESQVQSAHNDHSGVEKQTERIKFPNIPESQSIPRPASLSPSTNDLVAFKSTPLRLTHVHGSSSLVKLPTSTSST